MDCGMRFLAALALLWATSTRAASIDKASLVQQLVRDTRGEASMSFDKASLTEAVARTAVNHGYPLIMQDSRKRAVFMHVMARITKLVGAAGQSSAQHHKARDMNILRIDTDTVAECLKDRGLALVDFGLNLPGFIMDMHSCYKPNAQPGDCYGITQGILSFIGEVGDNLVAMFNAEQTCGMPFLDELLDCKTDKEGYFGMTPEQKNPFTFVAQSLTWAVAGSAAIWGAYDACKDGVGSDTEPVHPAFLIPTAAVSFLLSSVDFLKMQAFNGTDGEEPGRFEFCGKVADLTSNALGLFSTVMDTVSHVQLGDGSDEKKGYLPYCLGAVAGAVNVLPDIASRYCSYKSCQDDFPSAEFAANSATDSADGVA